MVILWVWWGRQRHNPDVMSIGSSEGSRVWKKLWRLNVSTKIKIFGSRVLHGLIPYQGVLANRYIGNSSLCPVCNIGCEDIMHTLFLCPRAQQVWTNLGLCNTINDCVNYDRSWSMCMEHIILNLGACASMGDIGLPEIILMGAWYIWWERRQSTHGEWQGYR
jgi:hypothetical protein